MHDKVIQTATHVLQYCLRCNKHKVACKKRSSVGRILLADLWWRNRSGKKLSCKRKKRNKCKGKIFLIASDYALHTNM